MVKFIYDGQLLYSTQLLLDIISNIYWGLKNYARFEAKSNICYTALPQSSGNFICFIYYRQDILMPTDGCEFIDFSRCRLLYDYQEIISTERLNQRWVNTLMISIYSAITSALFCHNFGGDKFMLFHLEYYRLRPPPKFYCRKWKNILMMSRFLAKASHNAIFMPSFR